MSVQSTSAVIAHTDTIVSKEKNVKEFTEQAEM